MSNPAGPSTLRLFALFVGGTVVLYSLGFGLEYSATPLGLVPVLDGRELLGLAELIANDRLPPEPFYRAMLFPGVVALGIKAGVAPEHLALAARTLNLALHLANAVLVGILTWQLWRTPRWAVAAAGLWGVYPVALYFAVDPFDITLAMTFLLAAAAAALKAHGSNTELRWLALASALLALAALTRPQCLSVVPVWIAVSLWLAAANRTLAARVTAVVLPALLLLLIPGALNWQVAGEFRLLPWQGGYNLWAANRPGTHGRYYEQRRPLALYEPGINPARAESRALFIEANPGVPATIANMNAYWRSRLLNATREQPMLILQQFLSKGIYLLNNVEQYNNKTYAYHKDRSSWLSINPLNWALLMSCGVAGALAGWRDRRVRGLSLLILAYSASVVLTYVSARFRLPIAPFLLVLAGGLFTPSTRVRLPQVLAAGALCLAVSLYPLALSEQERTFIQDELLIAKAASEAHLYDEALSAAGDALNRDQNHVLARELDCVIRFNRWLAASRTVERRELIRAACSRAQAVSDVSRRLMAHLQWLDGEHDQAQATWRDLFHSGSVEAEAAHAALILSSGAGAGKDIVLNHESSGDMLLFALAVTGDAMARITLEARVSAAEMDRQRSALARLFPGHGAEDGQGRL